MNDFHERFDIKIDLAEARRRFVNRSLTLFGRIGLRLRGEYAQMFAYRIGEEYDAVYSIPFYVQSDFLRCLQAMEFLFEVSLLREGEIQRTLEMSECDIGIRWSDGKFFKSGVKLLDDKLVNDPLKWLRTGGHKQVITPYEKGLRHFLESVNRAELLSDVVTDMYEVMEALAKIVTGKDKDLSANAELFLKKVKASDEYKPLLKQYIIFANKFRHGAAQVEDKPKLSEREVESFIYLTGTFIRLCM